MKEITIKYPKKLEKSWREGSLVKKWYKEYPLLFDEDDYRIVQKQSCYHFGEWFVAIHYFKRGYSVLVEKYLFKKHERKYKVIEKYLKPKEIAFLRKFHNQPPDLFVYKGKKFFFVEVKRGKDGLVESQKLFFKKIEKKLNRTVYIVKLSTAN